MVDSIDSAEYSGTGSIYIIESTVSYGPTEYLDSTGKVVEEIPGAEPYSVTAVVERSAEGRWVLHEFGNTP